eukprot:2618417-Amphidinium_carterae.2
MSENSTSAKPTQNHEGSLMSRLNDFHGFQSLAALVIVVRSDASLSRSAKDLGLRDKLDFPSRKAVGAGVARRSDTNCISH